MLEGPSLSMRITDAKVIVCSPGRNFVTLKLTTEDGIYGLGDATLNGRELAVASYLTDHLIPLLIGRDARRIEDIWQYLYKGAYWRRGPVTMCAISTLSQHCSSACARNSARTSICCMTCTTDSRPLKQLDSARVLSPIICSGWKIPCPPSCRKVFA